MRCDRAQETRADCIHVSSAVKRRWDKPEGGVLMRRRLILPLVPGLVQRGGLNPALGAEAELNTTERGSMHQRKLDDHRRSNRHFAMASRRVALIVLCLLVLLALGPAA